MNNLKLNEWYFFNSIEELPGTGRCFGIGKLQNIIKYDEKVSDDDLVRFSDGYVIYPKIDNWLNYESGEIVKHGWRSLKDCEQNIAPIKNYKFTWIPNPFI